MNPFLTRYRPLYQVAKRAILLFFVTFAAVTVLPIRLAEFGQVPNAFYGWIGDSLAVYVLRQMEQSLTPPGVIFIVIGPFDAFTVILEIGFYLALGVTLPYLLYGCFSWLAPGLSAAERRVVRWLVFLCTILFFAGATFTYVIVLPPIYTFSYQLQPVVGAVGTLSLESFVETTFMFLFAIGLAFEVPPICLGLSYAGLLRSGMMKRYWNYAIAGCFVVAFLISPGVGGGIIETLIAVALSGLYGISYVLVKQVEQRKRMGVGIFASG